MILFFPSPVNVSHGIFLPACYASPDQTGSQTRIQSEFYLWEHSGTVHTALSAAKISINGNTPMIELAVYVIPPDRK